MRLLADRSRPGSTWYATLFKLAVWFGIIAGLLETLAFAASERAGWLTWEVVQQAKDLNLFWAATLVNTALFSLLALCVAPVVWWVRTRNWVRAAVAMYAALAVYPAVAASGRIHTLAAWVLSAGLGVAVSRWSQNPASGRSDLTRLVPLVPLGSAALLAGIAVPAASAMQERWELARLPDAPRGRPNVLLIVLDTLRADRLGCYGYSRPTSPFLDELARRSVLFEHTYANAPWSLPSHASLFTGTLPNQHGADTDVYDGRFPTIAEILRERGYATVGIVANSWTVTRASGLHRGFIRWENAFTGPVDSFRRTVYGYALVQWLYRSKRVQWFKREPGEMVGDEVNRRLFRWLDGRPDRPFFAFLNYMDVHPPLDPPAAFLARFKDADSADMDGDPVSGRRDTERRRRLSLEYDASVAYLDSTLHQLFDELHRRNLDTNLLTIITSDHGEMLGERGLFGHQKSLYLPEIRIPLIIRYEGHTARGVRIGTPVGLTAVAPTIMDVLEFRLSFPDHSLATNGWHGQEGSGTVVSEVKGGRWRGVRPQWPIYQGSIRSLLTSQWHLLVSESGRIELYDWLRDPRELENHAGHPDSDRVVAALRTELETKRSHRLQQVRTLPAESRTPALSTHDVTARGSRR